MVFNFHSSIEFSSGLEQFATQRCESALNRFSHSIAAVQIRVSDENGPRGGNDTHCVVLVSLNGLPDVIVHKQSLTAESAITAAVDRAAHSVRQRTHRRTKRRQQVSTDNSISLRPVAT
jgi:ribosome-associated translation inhibitor RaiA